MLRKGLAVAALGSALSTLAVMAPSAKAEVANPFELTLGGGGTNGNKFNGFEARGDASIGYYFSENLELSLRQSLQYSDIGVKGKALDGSTRLALDLHIPLGDHGQWVPFVGGNIGYAYGDTTTDTWEAAPEAGLKWYVNSTTFIYGLAEYQFFFRNGHTVDSGFNHGEFLYTVGVGFRF